MLVVRLSLAANRLRRVSVQAFRSCLGRRELLDVSYEIGISHFGQGISEWPTSSRKGTLLIAVATS